MKEKRTVEPFDIDKNPTHPAGTCIGWVYFRTDKDYLEGKEPGKLEEMVLRIVATLGRVRDLEFSFVGYADKRGTWEYNQALSERRAEHVRTAFVRSLFDKMGDKVASRKLVFGTEGKSELPPPSLAIFRAHPEGTSGRPPLYKYRRVEIYVKLAKRTIEDLHKRLQKWARQAVERHRVGIKKLKEKAEIYRKRIQGRPNAAYYYNLVDFGMYEKQVEYYEKRYKELEESIETGDKAFWEWAHSGRDDLKRAQQRQETIRRLLRKTEGELKSPSLSDEEKQIYKEAIDFLKEDLAMVAEEIREIQARMKRAEAK